MKQWLLTASIDGIDIDHEEIIECEIVPDFWTCYAIAEENGCEFFNVDEITEVHGE